VSSTSSRESDNDADDAEELSAIQRSMPRQQRGGSENRECDCDDSDLGNCISDDRHDSS